MWDEEDKEDGEEVDGEVEADDEDEEKSGGEGGEKRRREVERSRVCASVCRLHNDAARPRRTFSCLFKQFPDVVWSGECDFEVSMARAKRGTAAAFGVFARNEGNLVDVERCKGERKATLKKSTEGS